MIRRQPREQPDDGQGDPFWSRLTRRPRRSRLWAFYNSGFIGAPGHMSVENLHSLVAEGNEIGGHTATPADLTALTPAEAKALVAGWGYNSARKQGDISSRFACPTCGVADTVRPADTFSTLSTPEVGAAWTVEDLQQSVMTAEAAPAVEPAPSGVNVLRNPGLETPGKYGLPECWQVASYGESTEVLSTLSPGHNGAIARRLDVTGYTSGDAKLLPVLDLGECSPSAVPGHVYTLRAWYGSTAPTQLELYYRNKIGTWTCWTASPWFPARTACQQAEWTARPVPADAVGISFGLNLFSNGELATDDYELFDRGVPAAP